MSSIPNPPEHTNENTTNTATQTRIGTRRRPSVTSPIGFPSTRSHMDPATACDGFAGSPTMRTRYAS